MTLGCRLQYGDVSPDGQYSTHIPNKGKRFNTMLGTYPLPDEILGRQASASAVSSSACVRFVLNSDALVGGRICVGSSALNVSKLGLTIAVRYACTRRQFGLPKQPGTSN